jgi:hypothetical protein
MVAWLVQNVAQTFSNWASLELSNRKYRNEISLNYETPQDLNTQEYLNYELPKDKIK